LDDEIFEQLRALMMLAREHRLVELEVESAEVVVRLRRAGPGSRPGVAAPPAPGITPPHRPPTPSPTHGRVEEIRAPLVGVFYHSSASDAPPYLKVGDWIEPGQTIGVIEAMKVFSEITSELSGRVIAIVAGNGELVEAGQALMAVELPE